MSIFEHMKKNNSRELLFFEEESLKLKAIVAIDSIVLGPANASTKLFNYETEDQAVADALDIAYFNSMRASLLRRSVGGGSVVLWGDPDKVKSEMFFRALGVFLNRWEGKLYISKSKGVSYADLTNVRKESKFILGLDESHNGLGQIYVARAKGAVWGLKAIAKHKFGNDSLKGLRILVQGIGDLGSQLIKELMKEQVEIIISDKIYDRIKEVQDEINDIEIVHPDDVYKTNCDIFFSCATEKLITTENVKSLNCKVLTGGTNQILKENKCFETLKAKDILYVPGYLINGGDIIQISNELEGYGIEKVESELKEVYTNTLSILETAKETGKELSKLATEKAEEYVRNVSAIKMLK
jgi:leucine dehydrogenase